MNAIETSFFQNHKLTPSSGNGYELTEGKGVVFLFSSKYRTHFFRSENFLIEELMVELPEIPLSSTRLIFGESAVVACYKAGKKKLSFLDDHPEGYIEFTSITKGRISGFLSASVKNQFSGEKKTIQFEFETTQL